MNTVLISLGKVWIQLFSLQLSANLEGKLAVDLEKDGFHRAISAQDIQELCPHD